MLPKEMMENNRAMHNSAAEVLSAYRHKKLATATMHEEPAAALDMPKRPGSLQDLGTSISQVHKILMKSLFVGGIQRSDELASKMCIPVSLLEEPIAFLRNEAMIEAHRRVQTSIGEILHLALTDRGRERASSYYDDNAYVGPLPVSYEQYCQRVEMQTVKDQVVNHEKMAKVYGGLIIDTQVLTQIGAAFNSGNSIFLFGPAGTGKTFIASQMIKLLDGDILIPYAIEVEGQVIRVFDPTIHTVAQVKQATKSSLVSSDDESAYDLRWVRCKRPVIIAAGELTLDMLDLKYQTETGFYDAPLQMRANGGILLIDDLGRQIANTSQLLNRWILPLENSEDYLSLHTGLKMRIPFDVIPVFSTNIAPEQLADEAFLRRLGYKVHIDYISDVEYEKIFQQYCEANGLDYDPEMVRYLAEEMYIPSGRRMTASHPKELINKVIDFSIYKGQKPIISKELLEQAWNAYFLN